MLKKCYVKENKFKSGSKGLLLDIIGEKDTSKKKRKRRKAI